MFEHTKFHGNISQYVATKKRNGIIDAGPGSGKTTTIFKVIIPALIASGMSNGHCIAFNVKNANDFKANLERLPTITAGTIHSTGLAIVKAANSYVKVNTPQKAFMKGKKFFKAKDGKCKEVAKSLYPEADDSVISMICQLVSLAKSNAFGISVDFLDKTLWEEIKIKHSIGSENDQDDIVEMAIQVFSKTISMKNEIDYDDMIFFAVYYKYTLPNYEFIIFDEAQDVTPITLLLLERFMKQGTRIIAVGDRKQAINSFMGAMANSIDTMAQVLDAEIMPLPVSYRCSVKAAEMANSIFPDSVIPNDNALPGSLEAMSFEEFVKLAPDMGNESVILSRTHKRLLPFAFEYISKNIPFTYKGIKEVAVKMLRTLWHGAKASKDLALLRQSLFSYQNGLEDNYIGKKIPNWVVENGEMITSLSDLIIRIELENGTYDDVKNYVNKLADSDAPSEGVTLSTIHASKGGQWEKVYLCGPLQSSLAKTQEELVAEQCLEFVAYTRSSDAIIQVAEPAKS